jgi:hypothetical protein
LWLNEVNLSIKCSSILSMSSIHSHARLPELDGFRLVEGNVPRVTASRSTFTTTATRIEVVDHISTLLPGRQPPLSCLSSVANKIKEQM